MRPLGRISAASSELNREFQQCSGSVGVVDPGREPPLTTIRSQEPASPDWPNHRHQHWWGGCPDRSDGPSDATGRGGTPSFPTCRPKGNRIIGVEGSLSWRGPTRSLKFGSANHAEGVFLAGSSQANQRRVGMQSGLVIFPPPKCSDNASLAPRYEVYASVYS